MESLFKSRMAERRKKMCIRDRSIALDAWVIAIFTILLLIIYFILISNKFVTYVREIISGVERMKSGDLMEEIPVRGEDEFSEIAASINEMRHNLYETMEAQKAVEKTKDELITNVAHDLRTPLTSILGYLDLLTQGEMCIRDRSESACWTGYPCGWQACQCES